jgi:hypothetical protein
VKTFIGAVDEALAYADAPDRPAVAPPRKE